MCACSKIDQLFANFFNIYLFIYLFIYFILFYFIFFLGGGGFLDYQIHEPDIDFCNLTTQTFILFLIFQLTIDLAFLCSKRNQICISSWLSDSHFQRLLKIKRESQINSLVR